MAIRFIIIIISLISFYTYSNNTIEITITRGVNATNYYSLDYQDKELYELVKRNLDKTGEMFYKPEAGINKFRLSSEEAEKFKYKKDAANFMSDIIYKKVTGKNSFFLDPLLFVKKENNRYQLLISDFEGNNIKPILTSPFPIMAPSIHKDNVVYVSFENYNSNIILHNIKTKERTIVSNLKGVNNYPIFNKDGSKILFSSSFMGESSDIYEYDILTKKINRLTNSSLNEITPEYYRDNIIFARENENGIPTIYSRNRNQLTRIFNTVLYTVSPSVSGDNIVAVFQRNRNYGIILKNNKEEKILKEDFYIESPSISKNGQLIVYSTKERGRSILEFMNTSGKILYQVKMSGADLIEPSF